MDWYYYLIIAAAYLFGCGCMYSYLINTKRKTIANDDCFMIFLCVTFWFIALLPIIGGYLAWSLYD